MAKTTLTDQHLAAWKSLLNAHAAAVGAIETKLSAAEQISLMWYDVLWALRKQGGGHCLRFRELQEEIVLSRSALSRLIDSLVKAGLVKKKTCPNDARGIDVELTDKGNKALASAWPTYSEGIAEYFAKELTREECGQLTTILGKVEKAAGW
jgi:DNA-binding MarR family transcriptional regulator